MNWCSEISCWNYFYWISRERFSMLFLFMNYFEWNFVESDFRRYSEMHSKKNQSTKKSEVTNIFCVTIKIFIQRDLMRSSCRVKSFRKLLGSLYCSWLLRTLYHLLKLFNEILFTRLFWNYFYWISRSQFFRLIPKRIRKKSSDKNFGGYKHFLLTNQNYSWHRSHEKVFWHG